MTSLRALACLAVLVGCGAPIVPVDGGADTPDARVDDAGSDGSVVDDARVADDAATFDGLTYLEDLHPMFEAAGCSTFACHGSTIGGSGLFVYMPSARVAYDDMLERVSVQSSAVIVRAGAPDESVLVLHAEGELVDADVLTVAEAARVRRWVADGAVYTRGGATLDAGVADAGMGDAGVGDDAGVPLTCALDDARGWPSLPSGCLPRCARETWDAVVGCRTDADPGTCQTAAIDADTMPFVTASGAADRLEIECSLCLDWQTRSCIDERCPHEMLAIDRCRVLRPTDACVAESNAFVVCRDASPDLVACQRARDPLCIDGL